jgi:hypothetical protein
VAEARGTVNQLEAALRRFPRDLRAVNVRWALVGGFAVSAYAGGRATADIDVAVAVDSDAEVERAIYGLNSAGYEVATLLETEDSGAIATVRLRFPVTDERELLFDLLVRTSGIEAEIVAAAKVRAVFPTLSLPVACLHHLLAMKVLSERDTRLQDRLDIQGLLAVASESDIEQARDALRLIAERGRDDGKDLLTRFEELRTQFA